MIDWTWLITAGAIGGTVANIYKKQWCFIVWLGTNSAWMIYDFNKGLYSQSFLFAVYVLLAVWGLIQWRKG
jgi:hypothetical protein